MKNKELKNKKILLNSLFIFFVAIIKYIKRHPIFIIFLFVMIQQVIIPATKNYQGVCLSEDKKLSDQEKIQLALSEIVNREEVCMNKKDKKNPFFEGEAYHCYKQIPIENVVEYLQKNSDCCHVFSGASNLNNHAEDPVIWFLDRMAGHNSTDVIRIKYLAHYIDKNNKEESEWLSFDVEQNNCGKNYPHMIKNDI